MRVSDGGTTWSLVLLLLCGSALAGYLAVQKPLPKPPAVVSVTPTVADFGGSNSPPRVEHGGPDLSETDFGRLARRVDD